MGSREEHLMSRQRLCRKPEAMGQSWFGLSLEVSMWTSGQELSGPFTKSFTLRTAWGACSSSEAHKRSPAVPASWSSRRGFWLPGRRSPSASSLCFLPKV